MLVIDCSVAMTGCFADKAAVSSEGRGSQPGNWRWTDKSGNMGAGPVVAGRGWRRVPGDVRVSHGG